MNPLTNMKNVMKLSERELYSTNKTSWHDQYRESAWVFVGGLPYDLTEGDIICIFSQYGEIVNINLIRDKDNGKSKGFCFICFEDQRSTDLSVDNLNGIRILNRTIRVDHVSSYKVPKDGKNTDAETKQLYEEGCAPKPVPLAPPTRPPVKIKQDPWDVRETLADQISFEIKLPNRLPIAPIKVEKFSDDDNDDKKKTAKEKRVKKSKDKSKKKKKKRDSSKSSSDDGNDSGSDEKSKNKRSKHHKREAEEGVKYRREAEIDARDYNQRQDRKRNKSRSVSPDQTKKYRSRSHDRDRNRRDYYKNRK